MADLPENPNNREEEYLADLAGQDGTKPNKPWSRKEAYLDAIDGRMDGIDAKIAALATDISLKGGVADYDHLPEDAEIGDAYITEDTGILYVWVGDEWTPLNMQGGSSVKVLTEADKNWPTNNPTDIATWLLEPGSYIVTPTNAAVNINPCQSYSQIVNVAVGQSVGFTVFPVGQKYVQSANRDVVATALMVTNAYYTAARPFICFAYLGTNSYDVYEVITGKTVINDIASSNANAEQLPISGKQSVNIYNKLFPMTDNEFNTLWENA